MPSKWDQFFGQQWNQNKQYDPLTHGLLEAVAGHDSDRIGDFAHAIGWDWLEKEADKNSATPERAIGRAALTAGAVYGAGAALGAGAGGGAGAGAGAGEAAGAGGLGAAGGYGAGNAFGDAAVFGAGGGEAAGGAAAGGLLGDAGYGAGNAFGDEAVFGSQGSGLLGDGGYVPWEDGFQASSANPVPNDPSTGMGQQLGQFGNSTQQTGDKLAREEDQRRAEARNSLRNGGELRGNRGEKLDATPFLYGRYLRPGRKA